MFRQELEGRVRVRDNRWMDENSTNASWTAPTEELAQTESDFISIRAPLGFC